MKLKDLIAQLETLNRELTIYAASPVTADSDAVAVVEGSEASLAAERAGLAYLIEVEIAQDVIEVWTRWRAGRLPTTAEACRAILYYAERDAYIPVESEGNS